jgi:hypothetical protein
MNISISLRSIVSVITLLVAMCAGTAQAVNDNAFICTDQQSVMINRERPDTPTHCGNLPYQLVCQEDGRYGCCKSACDCSFGGRVLADKGWGGGTREYVSYKVGGVCRPNDGRADVVDIRTVKP